VYNSKEVKSALDMADDMDVRKHWEVLLVLEMRLWRTIHFCSM
jgi:hypothetical protein